MEFCRSRAILCFVAASVLSSAVSAQVVGQTYRTAVQPSGVVRDVEGDTELRITIWYPAPSDSAVEPLAIGPPQDPLFEVGLVATDAPILPSSGNSGRRPVILLSHGFGGTARMMGWFAIALAKEGYIVVSVDHPGNNGMDEMTVAGGILWWERAVDLRLALEKVTRDDVLGSHVDHNRVGVAGFSAGGFTALLLGGARVDLDSFISFCRENPSDGVCRPQIEFPITEADRQAALQDPQVVEYMKKSREDYSVPAVRGVYILAPALVQAISSESLGRMSSPVSIVAGDSDAVAPIDTNALVAARIISDSDLNVLPEVGHYAFLASCTSKGIALVPVCAQIGDQSEAHAVAIEKAREFFSTHLTRP